MSEVPHLSVVVCTLDRAELLEGCLAALTHVVGPGSPVLEVVVVDNGSRDHTAAVVRAWMPRLAGLRLVVEPAVGLSKARNAGLAAARGDFVVFIDDDVRPAPDWAAALDAALDAWPGVDAAGGPVRLDWGGPPPRWSVEVERWFSAFAPGGTARLLAPPDLPVGANLAVRRDAALAAGGFDPALGRRGTDLRSDDEVEFLERLCSQGGGRVLFVPGAIVAHVVPASRASRRWVLRRAFAQGRTDASWRSVPVADREPAARRRAAWLNLVRAATRGWRSAARRVWSAGNRQAAALAELTRRVRRVGAALEVLRQAR